MRYASILWNLLGLGLPLLVAAATVPKLISSVGSERFGLLALAWGLIGYAGALDLGIGRATTHQVAALIGSGANREVPGVVATASGITLCTGLAGMLLMLAVSAVGVQRLVPVESVSTFEITASSVLLAIALPMQAMSATYRGVSEAYLRFRGINILRIALGIANFGGPFLVSLYTSELHWLIGTLVFSRGLALAGYRGLALMCVPHSPGRGSARYEKQYARCLLGFGGWVAVSSVVGPLLVQMDRFFVGAMISASAVTLYVLPYEVTIQALVLVGAVTSVAFPAISGLLKSDERQAVHVFRRWLLIVTAGMLVLMSTLAVILPDILRLWVGEHVSEASVTVGRIMCIGVFLNAVGAMYYSMLHAHGRTRATALLHIAELPALVLLLYVLIAQYGIEGAAIAWVLRAAIDTTGLIALHLRHGAADER